jgi:hypothetical protein
MQDVVLELVQLVVDHIFYCASLVIRFIDCGSAGQYDFLKINSFNEQLHDQLLKH